MSFGRIVWWMFLLILVFLILSRATDAQIVLNSAGSRFIETLGVLQGRDITSGATARVGGIAQ